MLADILETIKKEKEELDKWSQQVEQLEQLDSHNQRNDLYQSLKENIKNKMQLIEDLEFEALENQIAFEESQQKTVSSSSSSPHSQSTGSDFKSATSFPSEESSDMYYEKLVQETSPTINEASWKRDYQLPLILVVNTPKKYSPYDNSNETFCERSSSYSQHDHEYIDTLTYQYSPNNRPMSVSSVEPSQQSLNENNIIKFTRSQNQSSSVRSRSSFQKKINSRPLTRYLPNPNDPQFNLKSYIENCGHNLSAVENIVKIDTHSCYGQLLKLSGKHLKMWKKKSFIFDRNRRILAYYTSSTSTKLKGMISFDQIINVHSTSIAASKFGSIMSADTHHMFSIQLIDNFNRGRRFKEELKLSAHTAECQRIWMDVIFTGAEAYLKTLNENRTEIFRANNEATEF